MVRGKESKTPLQAVKDRFLKNTSAIIGLIIIILFSMITVLGYLIMPDDTPMANRMTIQLSVKPPGSSFTFFCITKKGEIHRQGIFHKLLYGQESGQEWIPIQSFEFIKDHVIINHYTGIDGENTLQTSYPLADIVYPLLNKANILLTSDEISFIDARGTTHKESIASLRQKVEKYHIKTKTYWMGTDTYGRDLWSRMILGSRVSLSVGFMAVGISLCIGTFMGTIAGFYQGSKIDLFISWLTNVTWSLPSLLFAIAISFALGKGFWQIFVAIGLSMWVDVARMVRGQVIAIRELEFIEAGRALGFKPARIIMRHILPNISGPILIVASANFASAILLEAGLSFLGFGAQPPFPTWGGMIRDHYGYIIMDAAYLAIFPGLAIMVIVYAFNLVSVGLTDAFNVKIKN